ncbi:MAG: orotidine-5'-phosphate decarboxylase [Candidatus Parcubacteria bacterium]|nr:orotidine-5'-phosphate decarboxylase [Candidatus Parcubacteria bacterium]
MKFQQKLNNIIKKNNSLLCIGLDPDLEKIPKNILKTKNPIFEFNKKIIDTTHDLVCVYKPNIAFYEAYGIDGLNQLKQTIEYIKKSYPEIPILLDAKRADIPNTSNMYAKAFFEYWDIDAVTVYPNLGLDSLLPFLQYKNKLTILLLKTSNPDSSTFQNISVGNEPYYLKMAKIIKNWKYNNIGLFVGATYPKELKNVRAIFPDRILLSAGLGAQSAEIEKAVKAGIDKQKSGIMFNASRSIIYARDPRGEAIKLRNEINKYR